MAFAEGSRVIMTDYTEEILALLKENVSLLPNHKDWRIDLLDWTIPDTYRGLLTTESIDIVLATDVIYKGSPYDKLCNLLQELASLQRPEILIIIPK